MSDDELKRWPSFARSVAPLPGGLERLQARLAELGTDPMSEPADALAEWPAATRTVEPLPGAASELRARLRDEAAQLARWPAATRTIEPIAGGLEQLRASLAEHASGAEIGSDPLSRQVAPLPGGLVRLRARLRDRRSRWFVPVAIAAAATIALVFVALRPRGEHHDRAAMQEMLAPTTHPEAIHLGLVERPPAGFADDPRVTSDVVVFRWVPPAQPTAAPTPPAP